MKNSIIIILTLFCLSVTAQKPKTKLKIGNDSTKIKEPMISIFPPDSIIFSGGDSLAVIKILVKNYYKMQERFYSAYEVINLININGTVTDPAKFEKAITIYRRITTN